MKEAATTDGAPWFGGAGPGTGHRAAPLVELVGGLKRRVSGDRTFELSVPRLTLGPGRAIAVVGPSGSGKSTLIDLLAMALKPDQATSFRFTDPRTGTVTDLMAAWRGRRLDALARLRSRNFGYVLQTGGLLAFLSVRANILLPQRLTGAADPARVEALAQRLGIDGLLDQPPGRLSVGQRQRVAIARALAHGPAIVLADEPTAALDPVNGQAVMDLFMALTETARVALVMATHDAALVRRYGLPMVEARIEAHGRTTRAVFGDAPAEAW